MSKGTTNLTMSRQFIFRKDAEVWVGNCALMRIIMIKMRSFFTLENGENNEQMGGDDKVVAVDDEEDIEVLKERDNNDADDDVNSE